MGDELLSIVHAWLQKKAPNTASVLLKEAKVKAKTGMPDLSAIYSSFRSTVAAAASSSSSDSDSCDSSDSDSDSSSEDEIPAPVPAAGNKRKLAESSDSSESDSDSEAKKPKAKQAAAPAQKKRKVESDSSDSDSESESDSDSDSSDSEAEREETIKRLKAREEERKVKAEEAAKAAAEWMATASVAPQPKNSKNKAVRSPGEAFKRVDSEVWGKEVIQGLEDNSYEKAFGQDGYGAKASAVLMTVRGKDFRHEKTKKKRGSYRGGEINVGAVNSFKYDD